MNFLDIIFLIPLIYFIINGFRKGLIIEVVSLIALFLAIIASMKLTNWVANSLKVGTNAQVKMFIAYIIVFAGVFLLVFFLGKFIERFVKTLSLNIFNRIAGSFFGVFKAVFLFSLIIWLSNQADFIPQKTRENSISYKYLRPVAPVIIDGISGLVPVFKNITKETEGFFGKIVPPEN